MRYPILCTIALFPHFFLLFAPSSFRLHSLAVFRLKNATGQLTFTFFSIINFIKPVDPKVAMPQPVVSFFLPLFRFTPIAPIAGGLTFFCARCIIIRKVISVFWNLICSFKSKYNTVTGNYNSGFGIDVAVQSCYCHLHLCVYLYFNLHSPNLNSPQIPNRFQNHAHNAAFRGPPAGYGMGPQDKVLSQFNY